MPHPRHVLTADLPSVASVLARSFYDDPTMRWLLPDDSTRLADLEEMFTNATTRSRLRGHTYLLPDGARVGAACMWAPPEVELMTAEERAEGPATVANRYGDEGRDRMRAFGALMLEHHPTEPHFYLWIVGVDPDLQGRGYGAQLLGPTLAHCDTTGMPAYLESSNPRNVPFYGRLGFAVRAEWRPEGGPLITGMWREPQ